MAVSSSEIDDASVEASALGARYERTPMLRGSRVRVGRMVRAIACPATSVLFHPLTHVHAAIESIDAPPDRRARLPPPRLGGRASRSSRRLGRHKSWVYRRLLLVEALDPAMRAD